MASVTFPTDLGGDGNTYTDDADPNTGLDGSGYIVRFIPVLGQGLQMAKSARDSAQAAASFVQQCQTLRQAVGNDRLAVAADRQHVDRQKTAVDRAASEAAQSAANMQADKIVHAPGSGLPNAAGKAFERDVVGGAGPLMVQGYAGLGVRNTPSAQSDEGEADFHVAGRTGLFRKGAGGERGPAVDGFPAHGTGSMLLHHAWDGAWWAKLLFDNSTGSGNLYSLFCRNGAVRRWQKHLSNEDMVGTVKNFNGRPVGSIIERDSNDDGEWVKFADGTMICFSFGFERTVTATNTDSLPDGWVRYGLASGNQIVFPQPFIDSPVMSFSNRNPEPNSRYKYGVLVDMGVTISGTEARPQIIFPHGPQTNTPVFLSYMAIGRWY